MGVFFNNHLTLGPFFFFLYLGVRTVEICGPMSLVVNNSPDDCSGHCDQCGLAGERPFSGGDPSVQGGLLVVCSVAVFILPLVLAAVGAFLGRRTALIQVGGAAAGFALGVLLAKGFTALLRVGKKK